MVGVLLVLGLAVDGGAVSAAPTSVRPAIDDAPVLDTAQFGPTDVTETVAADDVVRIPLLAGAAASGIGLELGEPFVVTIALGPDAVGFDGLLSFDANAVEFGGARSVSPGTALISNEQPDGAVSLAAFVAADAEPAAAMIEVRLTTAAAGQVEVSFEAFDSIAADGSISSAGATLSTVVSVADGTNAIDAPEVDARTAEGVAQGDLVTDLTGNGVVDETDLAELQLGWDELVAGGDTCDTSTDRLKTLDANGDGCLGVEDFAAVSDDVVPATRTAAASSMSASASTPIVVNVTTDTGLINFTNNICETTAGGCSLRGAIQQANVAPGPNRIEFDIPGNGPHTIQINDQLPTLNDVSGGTTIDGYTEPGAAVNTHPLQSNAILKIIIAPTSIVTDRAAIAISSSDNVIRGLSIINAPRKINMVGLLAARNHVVGNFIGTDPTGTFSDSSGGVRLGVRMVDGAHHNVIGRPNLADRNVITGNRTWGLRVEQNNTDYNVIQNNIVGLRPDGSDDLPQGGGIDVQFGAEYTLIGGNAQYEHNVFSGLNTAGVDNSHSSFNNRTIGNYIGTDLTGTFSNNDLRNYRGIWLKDDAASQRVPRQRHCG